MARADLHEAVARAIAEAMYATEAEEQVEVREAAAVVIRVVLAEAQRIVGEFPLNICGYGAPMPADHAASVEQFREAVLAALEPPPLV